MTTELQPGADADVPAASAAAPGRPRGRLASVLVAVIVVAVLAAAVATGQLWGSSGSSGPSLPSTTSVEAGFARDMSTHHQQAITMAGYTRDNTSDPQIKVLAYDIETSQYFQLGEMQGWLDSWGLSRNNPHEMAWMAGHDHLQADGLMPGMATPAELDKLESLHGTALDILFLQLMIRHHQGGLPMAQYAVQHAKVPFVRTLAQAMVTTQSNEVVQMEQLLRQLGGTPLPPPED